MDKNLKFIRSVEEFCIAVRDLTKDKHYLDVEIKEKKYFSYSLIINGEYNINDSFLYINNMDHLETVMNIIKQLVKKLKEEEKKELQYLYGVKFSNLEEEFKNLKGEKC